jgi:hypothetical protein
MLAPSLHGDTNHLDKNLVSLFIRMKGEFMDEEGSHVKYAALKKDAVFEEYKKMAAALKTIKLDSISEDERKALFLSILFKNIPSLEKVRFFEKNSENAFFPPNNV